MDRAGIKELLKEVLGPNVELIDHPQWVGLRCPMARWTHEKRGDSTPSAGVSIKENGDPSIYNCYVCGKGTLTWFLKEMEKYTGESYSKLVDSIETGEFLGGSLPEWGGRAPIAADEKYLDKDTYLELYDSAEGHWYFAERARVRGEELLLPSTIKKLGLLVDPADSTGDERILFPVYSPQGGLFGFSGRAVYEDAELKVRDYHGLPKSRVLLGSHLLEAVDRYVVVVEGLYDYAMMVQYDLPAVATMHAGLTPRQAEILIDIGKPVFLMYDNDEAGRRANDTAIHLLHNHMPVSAVTYPKQPEQHQAKCPKDPAACSLKQVVKMLTNAKLL